MHGGLIALAETDAQLAELEGWLDIAEAHEFDSSIVAQSEITKHIAVGADRWRGGLISPRDARAEPFTAVPAMARKLQVMGGFVRENCATRTIDFEGGKVAGVVTEAGLVRARAVVCAAGAWTNLLLSNIDVFLPQLVVCGAVARTVRAPEIFAGEAALADVFIRRRQDGGYTVTSAMTEHFFGPNTLRYFFKFLPSIGSATDIRVRLGADVTQQPFPRRRWNADAVTPFENHRILNPTPSSSALRLIRANLAKRIPQFAGIEFAETWAGMIDATPDVVPVMDQLPSHPGLFVATGFSGHGFGIGPGAGKVMADMVSGEPPRFDLTRFRFSRFSDGSRIRPGPAI